MKKLFLMSLSLLSTPSLLQAGIEDEVREENHFALTQRLEKKMEESKDSSSYQSLHEEQLKLLLDILSFLDNKVLNIARAIQYEEFEQLIKERNNNKIVQKIQYENFEDFTNNNNNFYFDNNFDDFKPTEKLIELYELLKIRKQDNFHTQWEYLLDPNEANFVPFGTKAYNWMDEQFKRNPFEIRKSLPQIQQLYHQTKLDENFIEGKNKYSFYKTLPSQQITLHNERSKLYCLKEDLCYPKIPMIHTYHHRALPYPPFAGVFSADEVNVPDSFQKYLRPEHNKCCFVNIQLHEEGQNLHRSLKTQYVFFPEAPSSSKETHSIQVEWTVIPGAEGKVTPEKNEGKNGLLKESVSIHPAGNKAEHPEELILSGDSMHVLIPQSSVDFYSFVSANNKAFVTYHWVLTQNDFQKFRDILGQTNTLRTLISGLNMVNFSPSMLNEFRKYVKLKN